MDCLFCGIVSKKVAARVVFESADSIAFLDINPRSPGHTLIIPKKHYEDITTIPPEEAGHLAADLQRVSVMIKDAVKADGLSIIQNTGKAAGQLVQHIHFHIIPRFTNERRHALEEIMPAQKLDDATMEKIRQSISGTPSRAPAATHAPRTAPSPKPKRALPKVADAVDMRERELQKPIVKEPPKKKKEEIEDDEIDFNF